MAVTQNIGLRITIGGITEVITNIKQLEDAISKARERLKGLEIGSTEFKRLTNDIRVAESSLKDLNKAAEGLEFEQKLEAFARVGGAITSSFAAAQAAVNLFGGDAEKVSEAAAKAQNLLTIALTARSVAEGAAGLKTVGLTIKTVAQTAATNASTIATRTLYSVIAANPIGALVTVIGLAVTALIAFTDTNQEAAEAQKDFNKQLDDSAGKAKVNVELLTATINNNNLSLQTRKKALDDLRTTFPAYFENLEDEAILTGKVKIETDLLTEALIKQARARALQTRLEGLATEELSNQRNLNKLLAERETILEKNQISLVGFLKALAGGGASAVGFPAQVVQSNLAIESAQQRSLEIQKEQKDITLEILNINQQIDGIIGTKTEDEEDTTAELEKQLSLLIERIRVREEELRLLLRLGSELQKLDKFELGQEFKNGNEELKSLSNSFTQYLFLVESYNKSVGKDRQLFYDKEISSLENIISLLDTNASKLSQLDFPEAKLISQRFELIEKTLKSFGSTLSLDTFRDVLSELSALEMGEAFDLNEIQNRRFAALRLEQDFIEEYVEFRIKGSENTGEALKAEREEYEKTGKMLFETLKSASKDIDGYKKSVEDAVQELRNLREESVKLASDPKILSGWAQQNRTRLAQSITYDLGDVEQNRKDIAEIEKIFQTGQYQDALKFNQDIEFLEFDLLQKGIDIRKVSYEEKLMLLKEYLEKEVKETEDAEAKKLKLSQDNINDILFTIQQFQSVLNALAQTTSQYYAFQLDLLAQQSEEIQSKIVGDSEEAVELRLEQEKIYNEKKKQLEKQSAVTALRISLAQSLANTAEAITRAFTAGPVVGQIAAGIIAGISAAQVALIGSQISQIQSLQRGGMIKGQGGFMVSGPSHEYGGVKFQGGGVELEGGEAVINRVSSIQYGGLLNQINQLGGGRPLTSNTFDDSRIVEALAKQRSEPIRAYVVEQDITNKQGVTRRLEQLSQI